MQKSERDQLSRLASLYSLQMLSEGARGLKCPVLKKTRFQTQNQPFTNHICLYILLCCSNTMQAVRIDMDRSPSLWSDFKRQRKTPPASVTSESEILSLKSNTYIIISFYIGTLDEAPPIDDNNIGNQILKCMGWTPGSGLGPQGTGRTSPVEAVVRPKYLGKFVFLQNYETQFNIKMHKISGLGHGSKSNYMAVEESSPVETASMASAM